MLMLLVVDTSTDGGTFATRFPGPIEAHHYGPAPDQTSAPGRRIPATALPGPDESVVGTLWSGPLATRAASRASVLDLATTVVANHSACWLHVAYGAHAWASRHVTNTVDFDILLSGSCELELDSECIVLLPGDQVVVLGAPHGWRAGSAGFAMSVLMVGIGPS